LFDEDEDARLNDLPEINDTLRKMYKVNHKALTAQKLQRLARTKKRSSMSKNLDSDDEPWGRADHKYAERVQNTQI